MSAALLNEALVTFQRMTADADAGRSFVVRFARYAQSDPLIRTRALAVAGALVSAQARWDLAGPQASERFWFLDGGIQDGMNTNDIAAMRLFVAALNDDPELAFDVAHAHEDTEGIEGVVHVIHVLMAVYSILTDRSEAEET